MSFDRPRLESLGDFLLHLLNPSLFILWGIALVAIAVAREQARVAVAVVAILSLAPLTADILKPLLAHSHDQVGYVQIGAASWPSGHSTAAAALALCAVLVAPPAMRMVVATVGAIFVIAVGASLLMLAWHMPSDVIGGWFVAATWTFLALAGLRGRRALAPDRGRASSLAPIPGRFLASVLRPRAGSRPPRGRPAPRAARSPRRPALHLRRG